MVAYFTEWKRAVKSVEELLFWVGFGLSLLRPPTGLKSGCRDADYASERSLFSVVNQGYLLILRYIAQKTCLTLSSLLEPKRSQVVQI